MSRTILDKETRRQQLLDAAIVVFARQGYGAASIDEIIETAGVARGTFYLYFAGKREIFLAIIDHYFAQLSQLLDRLMADGGRQRLSRAQFRQQLLTWLRFFAEHRNLVKIMYREATSIDPQFEERWNRLSERAKGFLVHWAGRLQEAGQLRQTLDPQALALFMDGMFHGAVCEYILRRQQPDLDWLVDQWVEFVVHGVARGVGR